MKRPILYIILFLSLSFRPVAQTDSVSYTVDTLSINPDEELENIKFIDAYNYVFQTRKKTNFLVRFLAAGLPFISSSANFDGHEYSLQFEQKLAKPVSLIGGISFYNPLSNQSFWDYSEAQFGLRYFLKMSERIKLGKQASNFTGNYIGLRWSKQIASGFWVPYSQNFYEITGGFQTRIFKNGFVDFNLGTGFSAPMRSKFSNPILETDWKWLIRYSVRIGFALDFKNKLEKINSCSLFKCFEEEYSLFKLDLLNIISDINANAAKGLLTFGYENKLAETAFSLNTEMSLLYDLNNKIPTSLGNGQIVNWKLGFTLEPRYYYGLKKRIATGKSANNLSGFYFGLPISISTERIALNEFYLLESIEYRTRRTVSGLFNWGYQVKIFKRGYFDWNIGLGYEAKSQLDVLSITSAIAELNTNSLIIGSKIRLGLAF